MSLGMSAATATRFDALCKLVGARGRGLSLADLGAAHALARELEAEPPDPERVRDMAAALGLTVDDLDGLREDGTDV